MNPNPSILPPDLKGVATITGKRGIGKTFLASQADLPQNMGMFDFEDKGEAVADQLKFSHYVPLTRLAEGDPIKLYELFDYHVANIPDNLTTIILDNISPLEIAFKGHVVENAKYYAKRYGLNAGNIVSGRFGGASSAANFMVGEYCTKLHNKGIRLIIQISHLGNFWSSGGIVPNKSTIKGLDRWQRLSVLSLVLIPGRPGEKPGVPAALVMKEQLGKISINTENMTPETLEKMQRGEIGHEIIRRLPQRIPECTFQKLRHYMFNPADIANPSEGEIPLPEEISPFEKKLSKEQFEIVHAMAIKEQKEIEEEDELLAAAQEGEEKELIEKIRPLHAQGMNVPEMAQQLGLTIPEVAVIIPKL